MDFPKAYTIKLRNKRLFMFGAAASMLRENIGNVACESFYDV